MAFCKDIYNMLSRKYPNHKIYLISDEHFFHQNIIEYSRSEFADVDQMNEHIINVHNEAVQPDDIVIFLGDFSFRNGKVSNLLARLNGHKYLIIGNHDKSTIVKTYPTLGFEGVFTMPVRLDNAYLSHEPLLPGQSSNPTFKLIETEFRKTIGAHNYHGHIHEETDFGDKYTNVTCEVLDYKPYFLGKTKGEFEQDIPLFINSPAFGESVSFISGKYNVSPILLLKDYVYTFILSSLAGYMDNYFVQGSIGLYKKYGFISDFSDIDITFLYNPDASKGKNSNKMKQMVDHVYYSMMQIDNANLEFYKRYVSLRIFEILLTTDNPYCVKCYMDSNLIFLDSYRDSDYSPRSGISLLERIIKKDKSIDTSGYAFPSYECNFINFYGDLANLLLELLFEDLTVNKRKVIIQKLKYILKSAPVNFDIKTFEDVFVRFFLRNIALFNTLNRNDEIRTIQKLYPNFADYFSSIEDLPGSKLIPPIPSNEAFMDIYGQISSINPKNALEKTQEIMDEYRQR